ncbi:oligomeric complex COG6 [Pluteus cervinus]|uniref:Oligomeric complex COG6 n=1 Tax=Pluteus cervinus TaxID=181527 RepID=A0ACD3B5B9_9AGAR|nr:oligomeric complex COG6 [Pluteus cervinus]
MEQKLIQGSKQFLNALGEVDQKLELLQSHILDMRVSCDEAEAQLKLTNDASKSLLERAGSLREQRQEVEEKKSIVTLFLARFTLNEEDIVALTSRDVPVGKLFFEAMDKTEQIRRDCRVLMAGEDGPTKAGLDIMASTSSYLEQGFEKISRWCTNEFRELGRETIIDVTPTLQEAIKRLRSRPELLTEVLSMLSQIRQATLLSSFITALTRGGPSGLPRPIELHAHDPMRYIGDMLAWVHQTIAAEREFLEGLFGLKSDGRMVGSIRRFDYRGEEEEWMQELLDLAVGKLCSPLKARVLQTVRSQESSIVSYKIANLLQFYMVTMHRTIGEKAIVSETLKETTEVAYKVFHDAVDAQGRSLMRVPLDPDDPSLTPPPPILEHAQILREIMTVYHSSMLGDESNVGQATGFQDISNAMVDPAIEMCITSSAQKKQIRPKWDQSVFILNCLCYLQDTLDIYPFTSGKKEHVRSVIQERIALLIQEHFADLLTKAGLQALYQTCEACPVDEPLSHAPGAQPPEVKVALQKFSAWLSSPEVVQSARLSHLTAQRLHAQVHQAALGRLAKAYRRICDEVRNPKNRYEAGSTLLGSERPFGQAHLLWQIFGLHEDAGDDDGDQ